MDYPQIYYSESKAPVKDLIDQTNLKSGFTESYFDFILRKHFEGYIFKNKIINDSRTYPYYPDYVLSIPKYNLIIDIEIDEPYSYKDRKPIHHNDSSRNEYFLSNGWDIIRFSEEQVVKYPILCCKVIAQHIEFVTNDRIWLEGFQYIDNIPLNKAWTKSEAEKMSKISYRQEYLKDLMKINFPNPDILIVADGIFLNREIINTKKLYKSIYSEKEFPEHIDISRLVEGISRYNYEFSNKETNAGNIYIELAIFISTYHSFNRYSINNDLFYYDNYIINVYFIRTDEFIYFKIDDYINKKDELSNIILIADDRAYESIINGWKNKEIRLIRKKQDTTMSLEYKYTDVDYILGFAIGLEGHEL